MKKTVLVLIIFIMSSASFAQNLTQTIRGKIIDTSSKEGIPFANVFVKDTDPIIGTVSDIDGNFTIQNVSVGRCNIQASFVGYEPVIIPEVVVTSSKVVILTIALKENSTILEGVVVTPTIQKDLPQNQMASVSARMLSVEEANRYAGGFDDPARLAASFAGVASNVSNNGIVIRGNAPKFLQWKMEGVEIPNPNHFADLSAFGGGGLTALSSQMLANSDFFTGAFPSEYTNALSGVFDIKMRQGNNMDHEHTVQLGLIGIDVASEGPLNKNHKSSYLFNYRYSTLGLIEPLLPEDAQGTNYQDLSFKFNFPTQKTGTFSLWGIGLIDNSGQIAEKDATKWEYQQDKEEADAKQFMGAFGINHTLSLNKTAYFNSSLAFSGNGLDFITDRFDNSMTLQPQNEIVNKDWNYTISFFLNKKYSEKHSNRRGVRTRTLVYDLLLKERNNQTGLVETLVDENGNSNLISAYTNSTFFKNDFTINVGLSAQLFTMNSRKTLEPRLGINYQVSANHKMSFGYGLHSRIERLSIYFSGTADANGNLPNQDLDFTKAHHFVLSYDWNISESLHLKLEPYYQYLFSVPVVAGTSNSLLNLQGDWFITDNYVNDGEGKNYGIDLTLEQFIKDGYYYMLSASVFKSEYTGGDGIWRDTRFNRSYLVNFLIGKEWDLKPGKTLGINLRFTYQGGDRFSPIDATNSLLEQEVAYNELDAFSQQTDATFVSHFTMNYKWNKPKSTKEISFKILNATGQKEFLGHRYNLNTNDVDIYKEALLIPNLSYKVSF